MVSPFIPRSGTGLLVESAAADWYPLFAFSTMSKPFKRDPQWARAKQLCRLNMEEIQMAKELGFTPKALMKNRPAPSEKWKLPVKLWIRELHAERFKSRNQSEKGPTPSAASSPQSGYDDDEEVPF